jgi:hypothetical protein
MRKISKARAAQLKTYAKFKAQFFIANPKCFCGRAAQEVHHKYGRAGWLLNATRYWISVCRTCHERIHSNPAWARQRGLLALRGEWLNPPK